MKKLSFSLLNIVLLVALFSMATAQVQQRDVVYLKNGSVIKGVVLEQIPDKTIRVQTSDGSIFVYQMSEVERIVKELMPEGTSPAAVETPQPERASGFLSIFGGGSLPIGVFAKKENEEDAGLAKFGFNGGLEYSHISDGGIYFAIGGTFISNPVDKSAMENMLSVFGNVSIDATPWTMGVPSMSLGFATTSPGMRLLFAGDFGYMFCSTPKVTGTIFGSTSTQESMKGNSPAFGGRFGIETPKKISIIVRYLTAKPKFEQTSSVTMGTQEMEQPISVILFILGIGF